MYDNSAGPMGGAALGSAIVGSKLATTGFNPLLIVSLALLLVCVGVFAIKLAKRTRSKSN